MSTQRSCSCYREVAPLPCPPCPPRSMGYSDFQSFSKNLHLSAGEINTIADNCNIPRETPNIPRVTPSNNIIIVGVVVGVVMLVLLVLSAICIHVCRKYDKVHPMMMFITRIICPWKRKQHTDQVHNPLYDTPATTVHHCTAVDVDVKVLGKESNTPTNQYENMSVMIEHVTDGMLNVSTSNNEKEVNIDNTHVSERLSNISKSLDGILTNTTDKPGTATDNDTVITDTDIRIIDTTDNPDTTTNNGAKLNDTERQNIYTTDNPDTTTDNDAEVVLSIFRLSVSFDTERQNIDTATTNDAVVNEAEGQCFYTRCKRELVSYTERL